MNSKMHLRDTSQSPLASLFCPSFHTQIHKRRLEKSLSSGPQIKVHVLTSDSPQTIFQNPGPSVSQAGAGKGTMHLLTNKGFASLWTLIPPAPSGTSSPSKLLTYQCPDPFFPSPLFSADIPVPDSMYPCVHVLCMCVGSLTVTLAILTTYCFTL